MHLKLGVDISRIGLQVRTIDLASYSIFISVGFFKFPRLTSWLSIFSILEAFII